MKRKNLSFLYISKIFQIDKVKNWSQCLEVFSKLLLKILTHPPCFHNKTTNHSASCFYPASYHFMVDKILCPFYCDLFKLKMDELFYSTNQSSRFWSTDQSLAEKLNFHSPLLSVSLCWLWFKIGNNFYTLLNCY